MKREYVVSIPVQQVVIRNATNQKNLKSTLSKLGIQALVSDVRPAGK